MSPMFAAFTVAIPVAIFVLALGVLNSYLDHRQSLRLRRTEISLTLATLVLVLPRYDRPRSPPYRSPC